MDILAFSLHSSMKKADFMDVRFRFARLRPGIAKSWKTVNVSSEFFLGALTHYL